MATAGTEAEKPHDNTSGKSIQGTVVVSGQISPEHGLRTVFEEILEECRHVQHGVLRVLSKDVRGYIGIFCGSYIAGAHVTTSREYGVKALKQLLVASRGMYAFLSVPEQQVELKQSLSLSLDELLNWQPLKPTNDELTILADAVDQLVGHSGRFDAISDTELGQIQTELLSGGKKDEPKESSFMAWGGDMPVLASNLSRFALAPRKVDTAEFKPFVEIERIPIPDDLDELAAAAMANLDSLQNAILKSAAGSQPQPPRPQPSDYNNLDHEAHMAGWNAADLDAIPTPAPGTAPATGMQQIDQDIQSSLHTHRQSWFGNINRSLDNAAPPAPARPTSITSPKATGNHLRTAPNNDSGRFRTQDDIALSALARQPAHAGHRPQSFPGRIQRAGGGARVQTSKPTVVAWMHRRGDHGIHAVPAGGRNQHSEQSLPIRTGSDQEERR
jgi:hypothetical protein